MLVETTKKLNEEVKEIKEFCASKMGELVLDGDADTIMIMSKMFKMLDLSMELLAEQANMMTDMNRKLDVLTARKES